MCFVIGKLLPSFFGWIERIGGAPFPECCIRGFTVDSASKFSSFFGHEAPQRGIDESAAQRKLFSICEGDSIVPVG